MSGMIDPIADHGDFSMQIENEAALIQQAVATANRNLERPGQYWLRLNAQQNWPDGRVLFGVRLYHVDLIDRTLTISEEWNGAETARRTHPLTIEGSPGSGA